MMGNAAGCLDIDRPIPVSETRLSEVIYKKIDGKTFADRIAEYDDAEKIKRVIETETHRCYNEGIQEVAEESKAYKTWATMLDDKVRETHQYLEGVTVPWDDYFYTFDGDKALFPGGFEKAENCCGCRCEVYLRSEG